MIKHFLIIAKKTGWKRTGRPDNRSKDFRPKGNFKPKESFEDKMARFLKASEENLSTLKRNTVSKQGGRGGRRA